MTVLVQHYFVVDLLIDIAHGVLGAVLRHLVNNGLSGTHLIADSQFLSAQVYCIRNTYSTVVIGIGLIAVKLILRAVQHLINRIAEQVLHAALLA